MDPTPDMRRDYRKGELEESTVSRDAIEQFGRWFDEAAAAGIAEPNAMVLATADSGGKPSARVLLLKGFDRHGFVFFTNYHSRKGRELESNPRASMVFFWESLERQVRVEGSVSKVGRDETGAYFHSRPRDSQIGAWASHQSGIVESREVLDRRQKALEETFGTGPIAVPDFWGGYRLIPESIEFWQGRPGRLHDRLLYQRQVDGTWKISRLEP